LEYLKKHHNEVLTKKVILKENTEVSQVARTKYKEIVDISSEDEAR